MPLAFFVAALLTSGACAKGSVIDNNGQGGGGGGGGGGSGGAGHIGGGGAGGGGGVIVNLDAPPRADANVDRPGGGTCGDGIVERSEQCDDGNTANGDGCSRICQIEANWD
ncbi:MAG TPA: DUF4215 domain-containing protein, partial [Polyangia bacterium]